MSVTLTERLTSDWAARRTSGAVSMTDLEEWRGWNKLLLPKGRPGAVPWVDFVLPVPEEDMSYPSTEILFPKITEEFVPRTPLGRKLLELRNRAIQAGMRLLNADEVLEEVKRRRGELEDDETNVC